MEAAEQLCKDSPVSSEAVIRHVCLSGSRPARCRAIHARCHLLDAHCQKLAARRHAPCTSLHHAQAHTHATLSSVHTEMTAVSVTLQGKLSNRWMLQQQTAGVAATSN
eukprot:355546-Chlamydomonas_euryale.AAC.1